MNRARGFSLVELMIAILLGLLVAGAVISIFLGSRSSYSKTNGTSALTDDGRFSTDFINRALRSTGFIGCTGAGSVISTGPNPAQSVLFDFPNALSGYEAVGTNPTQTFTLSSNPAGDSTVADWTQGGGVSLPNNFTVLMPDGTTQATGLQGLAVKFSDILVVHGTLQTPAGQQTPPTNVTTFNTGSVVVNDATGFQVGGLAVVSDCAKAEVFQITGITGTTISFAANSTMSMGNTSGTLIPGFDSGELFIPTTSIYFVGVGSDGDGALMRGDLAAKNDNSGTYYLQLNEIVPDVENMQILYGIDPTGSESATSYVTADQAALQCPNFPTTGAASFNCVRSLQIGFVVASPLQTVKRPAAAQVLTVLGTTINAPGPPNLDTRQRTVYQVTVALRNTLP